MADAFSSAEDGVITDEGKPHTMAELPFDPQADMSVNALLSDLTVNRSQWQTSENRSPRSKAQPHLFRDQAGLRANALPTSEVVAVTSPSLEVRHASPLSPLRLRDRQALSEIFEHDCLDEIAQDIHAYLARMYPEPCWEDEPYDFLGQYL